MNSQSGEPLNLLNADLRNELHRREIFSTILTPIRIWLDSVKLAPPGRFVNPHLLLDVISHCQRDLNTYRGPDSFKIGGHLGFWIARIKPFRAFDKSPLYTNETLGLLVGLLIVRESMGSKAIHHKIHANLLYDLRYGTVTPTVLSNQLQLLYSEEIRARHP